MLGQVENSEVIILKEHFFESHTKAAINVFELYLTKQVLYEEAYKLLLVRTFPRKKHEHLTTPLKLFE